MVLLKKKKVYSHYLINLAFYIMHLKVRVITLQTLQWQYLKLMQFDLKRKKLFHNIVPLFSLLIFFVKYIEFSRQCLLF